MKDRPATKEKSLNLTGISMLVGDAALFAAGASRAYFGPPASRLPSQVGTMLAGGFAAAGGAAAAVFGSVPEAKKLRIEAQRLEKFLRANGVTLPSDAREQEPLLKSQGFIDTMGRFLYTHPSQMLTGFFLASSVTSIYAGGKALQQGDTTRTMDLYGGLILFAGSLAGLLIKEDPHARKKTAGGSFLQKSVAYVKQHPLQVSAGAFLINNGLLFTRGIREFRERTLGDQRYLFPVVAASAYLLGNVFLASSKKDTLEQAQLAPHDLEQLEALSSRIIAQQSPKLRVPLLQEVSRYLALRHPNCNEQQIYAAMQSKLASLPDLAGKLSWQARVVPANSSHERV